MLKHAVHTFYRRAPRDIAYNWMSMRSWLQDCIWAAKTGDLVGTDGLPSKGAHLVDSPACYRIKHEAMLPILIEGDSYDWDEYSTSFLPQAYRPWTNIELHLSRCEGDATPISVELYSRLGESEIINHYGRGGRYKRWLKLHQDYRDSLCQKS